jgi:hypothetical protein
MFLSRRIYAGYATNCLNPEPYAYEYGFSAKWLIEAQVVQEEGGAQDPIAGVMSYTNGGPLHGPRGAPIFGRMERSRVPTDWSGCPAISNPTVPMPTRQEPQQ